MKRLLLSVYSSLLLAAFMGAASAWAQEDLQDDLTNPPAFAEIKGTAEGSTINGKVAFYETEDGLIAVGVISGVAVPGKHGFHIHEHGSCDDMGNAAGGHYNPHGVEHGFLPEDGLTHSHAGDMGNIEIDENGNGELNIELHGISLLGVNAVMGKAVIFHEKEDDFGEPTGNAGGRIGCGIIVSSDGAEAVEAPVEPEAAHDHAK